MRSHFAVICITACAVIWAGPVLADEEPAPPARSAADSLAAIGVPAGFIVEQVAKEPQTMDPVALAFGPDGKLWVVEMADYPLGIDNKGKPGGRVRFLESTKNDGVYDKSTLFLDNISFPNGVMPWKKGVLITAAPDIIYAEDTDGDGKADIQKVLYTGFKPGNQQHRANGLKWGVDNWVYVANGDSGGAVRSVETGKVVDISGRDLRIRPDGGLLETQTGMTQFGRATNDWGDWFGCNNPNPIYQFALADQYLRRNPHFAAPPAMVQCTSDKTVWPLCRPLSHWVGYKRPPAGKPGEYTSACGLTIYRDDLFGAGFEGNAFVCEPVHSLVHRMVLTSSGVLWNAQRAQGEERSEFFASRDPWTRPTTVTVGPDGALYITDMYRLVLEHPEWIGPKTQEMIRTGELRAGEDKGRIYRVYPEGKKPRAIPRLDKLDTAGLVAALDSPSGWQRDTAQQMLLWRGDRSAVSTLEQLAANSQRPQARLHALGTLDGLGALSANVVMQALHDAHPGVRRHAARLCERLFDKNPAVGPALAELSGTETDPFARQQIGYSLGEWKDPRAGAALAAMALCDESDPYLLAAVMSSAGDFPGIMLAEFLRHDGGAGHPKLVRQVSDMVIRRGDKQMIRQAIAAATARTGSAYADWQYAGAANLLEAIARARLDREKLFDGEVGATLRPLFASAAQASADSSGSPALRSGAVALLGQAYEQRRETRRQLAALLNAQTPVALQADVVRSLAGGADADTPSLLLPGWSSHGPAIRGAILDALLSRAE